VELLVASVPNRDPGLLSRRVPLVLDRVICVVLMEQILDMYSALELLVVEPAILT